MQRTGLETAGCCFCGLTQVLAELWDWGCRAGVEFISWDNLL